MPALAISMEKDINTNKFRNKKSNSYEFISDIAESNFFNDFALKTWINLLNFMLSRILVVMFKVKQLFAINYLLVLLITLLSSFQQLWGFLLSKLIKVWKSDQNKSSNANQKPISSS